MTVKQAVKENKLISIILGVLAGGLLAWGIWVTDASYKTHFTRPIELRNICDKQEELEIADEKIKKLVDINKVTADLEMKEERLIMANFQKEILLMFIAIQKQIRER